MPESDKRRKLALNCKFYEPKSKEAKNMTVADTMTFKRVLNSENCLFSVLPEDSAEIEFIETSYGAVPKGNLLLYQLSLKRKSENAVCKLLDPTNKIQHRHLVQRP